MSYLPSFGPTSFEIEIGNDTINRCVQLTATTTPPNGTYTMSVGQAGTEGCSNGTLHEVATVTLDEDGNITSCTFSGRFGNRGWKSMTGSFDTDGTGGGDIEDDSDPTGVNGVWAAGGGGEPFPTRREHRHGHHA